MEISERNYAWDGERMPHHQSGADGEPSSSGRADDERPESGDLHLRSVAHLPRSSRNGTESLPLQPAEDVMMQDEYAARRHADLRARPPSPLVRGPNTVSVGRRTRRRSVADFLGIKTAGPSQDTSAAPSCDVTLHGMGAPPPSTGRSRRASFVQTLGFGAALLPANEHPDAAHLDSAVECADASKSFGGMSGGRRRRASMLDMFRHPSNLDTTAEAVEGPPVALTRQKSSVKVRRASVMDFFRSSATGMAPEEQAGSTSMARSARHMRGEGGMSSRAQRRRSVIDILGQSSKKVFAKLMNQDFEEGEEGEDEAIEGRLWFTSLDDFKPLTFKYVSGRYSSAFFACSVKTGQHYILKKFDKDKMSLSDLRGIERARLFANELMHEHIVQCCGLWDDDDAMYMVEEYSTKGDLLQDSMSHPEKYTEAFMATKVVKPLLEVLVYLHQANIVHRAIFPEHVLFGREDKLTLGHFTSAIRQTVDAPTERIHFLDYMAPEMLAVRVDNPVMPAPLVSTSRAKFSSSMYPNLPTSPGGDPSMHDRVSPLSGSRQPFPDVGSLGGSPHSSYPELPEKASASVSNSRNPLNIFRSARRLSPQQQLDEEAQPSREPSSLGGNRRFRGEPADGAWPRHVEGSVRGGSFGAPTDRAPIRRRRSVVDEMSAPWLRPVGSDQPGGPMEPPSGGGDTSGFSDTDVRELSTRGGGEGERPDRELRAPSQLPASPHPSVGARLDTGSELPPTLKEAFNSQLSQSTMGGAAAPEAPPQPRPMSLSRRPGSALGPPLVPRPGSAIGPGPAIGPPPDDCLPGYAADPPPLKHHPNSTSFRSQTSRVHGPEAAAAALPSGPGPSPVSGPGQGPGPVMESLVVEQTPTLPYDSADMLEIKRARAGVSFTTATTAFSADDSVEQNEDGRTVRSRIASRELSATAGGGQVIMGLRTMARNITAKIGQVLAGRGDAALGPNVEPCSGEVAEGGGPREPTPRQSLAGAADATTIIMPNNPWEWQDHYNEKVDLWQVGCLVHEILCLSLPFEAEDKLLACALILWADITNFPDHLSSECHNFIRACLTKNPAERPSAAQLLQHPWIVRHAAGEVIKSVRQEREEEGASVMANGQPLTVVQRAAAAVGMGWMVGVGSASAGAGAANEGARQGAMSWLLRPWTSKVAPGGAATKGDTDGEAKFEMAMAMVQEQQIAEIRRRSVDVEAGAARRHSIESRRQSIESRRHSIESARNQQQADPSMRWNAMM